MPNIVLIPQFSGSFRYECRRLEQYMIDELRRYLTGEDLQWEIIRKQAAPQA